MKSTLILSALATILFFSCEKPAGKQYVGTWTNKEHRATIRIKKDGDNFLVQTIVNNAVSSTFTYNFKDNQLVDNNPALDKLLGKEYISYVNTNGHLSFQGIEWERAAN